jgi:UDP-MurNAc hydroxylase
MVRDLEWLGFYNVTEIPHGSQVHLGKDFTLSSYQFGPSVDSAMLLSGGGYTLFNCNDCKYFGLPLRQITRRFPKIDFVLRSHSSASAVPYCIDGYKDIFPELRRQQDYIEEFCRFALFVGARYAVPFASNHCFLHKETFHFNDTVVVGDDIPAYYGQLTKEVKCQSQCVVMPPGSSWSDKDGFQILSFDYSNRDEYLQGLLTRHEGQLARQYVKEEQTLADFEAFRLYFENFLRAIPWLVRKWLRYRIVFRTRDQKGEHNWLVDFAEGKVEVMAESDNQFVVLETPPLVLNDCTKNWMFSVWTASKRVKIYLPSPIDLDSVNTLFSLLDLYELETLPLWKNLSRRALSNRLRRWREILEAVHLFFKHKVLGRHFVMADLYDLPVRAKTP